MSTDVESSDPTELSAIVHVEESAPRRHAILLAKGILYLLVAGSALFVLLYMMGIARLRPGWERAFFAGISTGYLTAFILFHLKWQYARKTSLCVLLATLMTGSAIAVGALSQSYRLTKEIAELVSLAAAEYKALHGRYPELLTHLSEDEQHRIQTRVDAAMETPLKVTCKWEAGDDFICAVGFSHVAYSAYPNKNSPRLALWSNGHEELWDWEAKTWRPGDSR